MKYYPPRYVFRRYEIMQRVNTGEHFLEIGPGNLFLAKDILSKLSRGTLMDLNTTDVQQIYDSLKEPHKQKLKLIIADFVQYDQSNMKYDCVIACEVLEHIEDDISFLRKVNELLINQGQLILPVPAGQRYWSKHDEIVGHYRRYEKKI